ncbi:hypothetical protein BCD67_17085 [Oscillatoriales cyanobacterium USR001]|nr:hypothetical protein BCD67_17085 [Oscillatoriales cyanobacterium USR001]
MIKFDRILQGIICGLAALMLMTSVSLAEIKETHFTIDSNGSESFPNLIEEAEDIAKKSIDREFRENPNLTEISIVILVARQRQVVPILRSRVERSQWQKDPRIDQWTRYFADAKFLLELKSGNSTETNAPSRPTNSPLSERRRLIENDPGFRDD